MGRILIDKCDKCGQETVIGSTSKLTKVRIETPNRVQIYRDLCPPCNTALRMWLEPTTEDKE